MPFDEILKNVGDYYSGKVREHGPTAKGVDWNSPESQTLRFDQLLKLHETAEPFSLIDYGCGYGAMAAHMAQRNLAFRYMGFDISEMMISTAKETHARRENCEFTTDAARLTPADYTVASGIFNVRLKTNTAEWERYVFDTIEKLNSLSIKGFAFNILTGYADPEYKRQDLYYPDPCFYFDYCKRHYSRHVSLLHDYGLYEFTILVRKLI